MNCEFCHNKHLISGTKIDQNLTENYVLDFLKERIGFLDGVVVSGGEPTIEKDLKDFIYKIKKLGFKVKLDTNGTNFEVLEDLIESHLVDYVAMDIKAPKEKYRQICGVEFSQNIEKSVKYLLENHCEYEFRTTFYSMLSVEDIESIARNIIPNAKRYYIQRYNKVENALSERSAVEDKMAVEVCKNYVKSVKLR